MAGPLLQINNFGIDFVTESGRLTALNNISLEVNQGEIVAIVGESGSGKSVTALSILQLLPTPPAQYSSGEILFFPNGNKALDLLTQSAIQMQKIRGNQIAMIFQEPMSSLNPVFTCGDQVMEAIRLHKKIPGYEAKTQTIELFAKVKLSDPSGIFNRYPHQLSGGQKQRVMIAMAISCNPSLLICDEPTTALDVTAQNSILELIKELQRTNNMGVIFITHDFGVVAEIASRAIVLYKGNIVEEAAVRELFTRPNHPYTRGLLNCRPVLHRKGERLPVVTDFMEVNESGDMIEKLHVLKPEVNREEKDTKIEAEAETLIRVEHLCIWHPLKKTLLGKPVEYLKAVDDISFEVYEGETLGLVGESGSGKSTLGRSLLRLIMPTSGKIIFNKLELSSLREAELKKLRRKIQIIFQDPYSSLNPRLTIGSAIAEPLKVHHILPLQWQRRDKVIELLEKVNLKAEHFHRYPHEFSGGQRQRIVIARALALNPSFIVCDESVSALDVSVQAQVLNLFNDLKKEFGFTVIFISHDFSVVRYISDRILVMNKGKMEEIGAAEEICQHPKKEYTKKLIASIPKGIV
jgi:peptide/nickel transport system ATP-binding protein